MEEKNSTNIYDIANASGVSIATVSRVISGSGRVSERTRKKVLDVIDRLNYVPNAFARGLGLGSMKMVGILCTDVSDIFYAKAVSFIEHYLRQYGLNALLYCTGYRLEEKRKGLDILLSKRVDAMILVGSATVEIEDNTHILAAASQTPVFIVNGLIQGENIYCVCCDEKQAMYENALNLLNQGCENILYLYDKLTYSGLQKLEGLQNAYQKHGSQLDKSLLVQVEKDLSKITRLVLEMLNAGKQFDGVLVSEDILAVGACKALAVQGKRLPVIGFNNSILAECATPALTSMDNMLESMCTTAVSQLNDVLEGKTVPQLITISGRLVERETFLLQPLDE